MILRSSEPALKGVQTSTDYLLWADIKLERNGVPFNVAGAERTNLRGLHLQVQHPRPVLELCSPQSMLTYFFTAPVAAINAINCKKVDIGEANIMLKQQDENAPTAGYGSDMSFTPDMKGVTVHTILIRDADPLELKRLLQLIDILFRAKFSLESYILLVNEEPEVTHVPEKSRQLRSKSVAVKKMSLMQPEVRTEWQSGQEQHGQAGRVGMVPNNKANKVLGMRPAGTLDEEVTPQQRRINQLSNQDLATFIKSVSRFLDPRTLLKFGLVCTRIYLYVDAQIERVSLRSLSAKLHQYLIERLLVRFVNCSSMILHSDAKLEELPSVEDPVYTELRRRHGLGESYPLQKVAKLDVRDWKGWQDLSLAHASSIAEIFPALEILYIPQNAMTTHLALSLPSQLPRLTHFKMKLSSVLSNSFSSDWEGVKGPAPARCSAGVLAGMIQKMTKLKVFEANFLEGAFFRSLQEISSVSSSSSAASSGKFAGISEFKVMHIVVERMEDLAHIPEAISKLSGLRHLHLGDVHLVKPKRDGLTLLTPQEIPATIGSKLGNLLSSTFSTLSSVGLSSLAHGLTLAALPSLLCLSSLTVNCFPTTAEGPPCQLPALLYQLPTLQVLDLSLPNSLPSTPQTQNHGSPEWLTSLVGSLPLDLRELRVSLPPTQLSVLVQALQIRGENGLAGRPLLLINLM